MLTVFTDEYFMGKALEEALLAYEEDEIPIGAVIVCENKIIGKGHNQTEKLTDVTAHAEMIAITAAASFLNSKYLHECTLYVTIEPCLMCAGAIRWARFQKIVYGAAEPKFGYTQVQKSLLSPSAKVQTGVMETECRDIMKQFFQNKRK